MSPLDYLMISLILAQITAAVVVWQVFALLVSRQLKSIDLPDARDDTVWTPIRRNAAPHYVKPPAPPPPPKAPSNVNRPGARHD